MYSRLTIEDIARMADVSKATVSRVINNAPEGVSDATRARIKRIIEEVEYKPNLLARGVATSKTKTIGLIMSDIGNPVFGVIAKAVESRAHELGYTMLLGNANCSSEREQRHISTFISKQVDGVILISATGHAGPAHARLKKYEIPCVLLSRFIEGFEYDAGVFIDDEYAVFEAARLLIENGNRQIAYAVGPKGLSTTERRFNGYRLALKHYGIPMDDRLILWGDYSAQFGYLAVHRLTEERTPFTAVLAGNDTIALGELKALKELGLRVPQDVEVVGFDNAEVGEYVTPALTTVEQPFAQMGKRATELLVKLMNRQPCDTKKEYFNTHLILRESTKPRPTGGG